MINLVSKLYLEDITNTVPSFQKDPRFRKKKFKKIFSKHFQRIN